jgi:hypothetical protein
VQVTYKVNDLDKVQVLRLRALQMVLKQEQMRRKVKAGLCVRAAP